MAQFGQWEIGVFKIGIPILGIGWIVHERVKQNLRVSDFSFHFHSGKGFLNKVYSRLKVKVWVFNHNFVRTNSSNMISSFAITTFIDR